MEIRVEISKLRLESWLGTHLGMRTQPKIVSETGAKEALRGYFGAENASHAVEAIVSLSVLSSYEESDNIRVLLRGDYPILSTAGKLLQRIGRFPEKT